MASKPTVAVCFPSGDMVHADFALSLAALCASATRFNTTIINAKSSIVAEARNRCVELAKKAGAEHLLFVDSDMVFPSATLDRLMAHGKDVVGATYPKRVAPHAVLGAPAERRNLEDGGALVEMRHLPTGCLLIRTAVFDALDRPPFRFSLDPQTGAILGEDYDFCDRARGAGFSLWCDVGLSFEIGHIGQSVHRLQADML